MDKDEDQYRLEQNRSGYFEIRWQERGRSRSVSTRTKDRAIARQVLQSFVRAETQARLRPGGPTVGDVLDGYEAAARTRGVGATTLAAVRVLRVGFGDYRVPEITPDVVDDWREDRGVGVSSGTVRRDLNVLVAALNWSVKHKMVSAHDVPAIELPPGGEARVVWLDEDEDAKLFALASRRPLTRAGLFTCIGLDTGARKRAIEGLTWDRVDLNRGLIDFRDPAMRVTKKRRVATPITDRLMPVLEGAKWARGSVVDGGAYVLGHKGNTRKCFATFVASAGMPHVTAHVLRHTRITLLLRAGVAVWDVSKLVGASVDVIESVYGHHRMDDRLRAEANRRAAA